MRSKHRPQRSCAVCRRKTDKRALTRLVFTAERLRVDPSGKLSGRGAYLCDNADCWMLAAARPVVSKALRRELSEEDRDYLRQMTPS
ncbi:MAG: YlxR family protein [Chloroflexota bacterium]|nr:YlxR family protein [Chloroflexota bacterium]MDE2854343.1 YlxR family protein [Chloroflexota bacterium]MDE2947211.1 YlxR family protein [Chloroflexota bacterium]